MATKFKTAIFKVTKLLYKVMSFERVSLLSVYAKYGSISYSYGKVKVFSQKDTQTGQNSILGA